MHKWYQIIFKHLDELEEGQEGIFDVAIDGETERLKLDRGNGDTPIVSVYNEGGKSQYIDLDHVSKLSFVGHFSKHPKVRYPVGTKKHEEVHAQSGI